jgi:hypothetical protein
MRVDDVVGNVNQAVRRGEVGGGGGPELRRGVVPRARRAGAALPGTAVHVDPRLTLGSPQIHLWFTPASP